MVSPGLFVMVGGLIGCILCLLAAFRYRSRWEDERIQFLQRGTVTPIIRTGGFSRQAHAKTINCCPFCGAEVRDEMLFCEHCGRKLQQ